MKKLNTILLTGILFVTVTTQAQVKQGAIMLGGDFGISSEKRDNNSAFSSKQTGFSITPVFGYAVKDNLVIGGDLYYSEGKYDGTPPAYDNKNSYRGAGFFVRHYRALGHSGFSLFVQGRIGYQHYRFTQTGTTLVDDLKRNELRTTVNPGLTYTINKRWQFETGLSNLLVLSAYSQKQTISAGSPSNYTAKGMNLIGSINPATNLYVGLRFLLNK